MHFFEFFEFKKLQKIQKKINGNFWFFLSSKNSKKIKAFFEFFPFAIHLRAFARWLYKFFKHGHATAAEWKTTLSNNENSTHEKSGLKIKIAKRELISEIKKPNSFDGSILFSKKWWLARSLSTLPMIVGMHLLIFIWLVAGVQSSKLRIYGTDYGGCRTLYIPTDGPGSYVHLGECFV